MRKSLIIGLLLSDLIYKVLNLKPEIILHSTVLNISLFVEAVAAVARRF